MIRVYYEEYFGDDKIEYYEREFKNLTDLEDWIFGQMQRPYDKKRNPYAMIFPQTRPSKIEFTPTRRGPSYWIRMIENNFGTMFTDGKYTGEYTNWNDEVKEWLAHCDKRRELNFL